MRNGNYLREKKEAIYEHFKTQEGLWEFFTATAIWYFLIVEYIVVAKDYVMAEWLKVIPIPLLAQYVTYLTLSIIFTAVGYGISFILISIFTELKHYLKKK